MGAPGRVSVLLVRRPMAQLHVAAAAKRHKLSESRASTHFTECVAGYCGRGARRPGRGAAGTGGRAG